MFIDVEALMFMLYMGLRELLATPHGLGREAVGVVRARIGNGAVPNRALHEVFMAPAVAENLGNRRYL